MIIVYLVYNILSRHIFIYNSEDRIPNYFTSTISHNTDNDYENVINVNSYEKLILWVSGFPNIQSTKQFIWRWQQIVYYNTKTPTISDFYKGVKKVLSRPKSTSLAIPFADWANKPLLHIAKNRSFI